jgi:hypothetical protein
MGGGKTHSMIALGLLARDPALRHAVLGTDDPAPELAALGNAAGMAAWATDSAAARLLAGRLRNDQA